MLAARVEPSTAIAATPTIARRARDELLFCLRRGAGFGVSNFKISTSTAPSKDETLVGHLAGLAPRS